MEASNRIDDDQEQTWVVVKRRNGQDVFVEMQSDAAGCTTGHCGAGAVGCQSNAFVGLFATAPLLRLKDVPITVNEGDRLLLSLPRKAVFQLAFLGYGLPLFALLLGLWLGQTLAGDLTALFLGISALLMTWLVVGKLGLVIEPKILDSHLLSV